MGLNGQEESDTQRGPEDEENARVDGVDGSEEEAGELSAEEKALLDRMNSPEDFEGLSTELEIAQESDAEEGEGGGKPQLENSEGAAESEEGQEDSGQQEDESGEDKGEGSEDEGKDEGDDDDSEAEKRARRYRLRTDDPVKQRAFDLLRRNQDMSLAEAEQKARAELGVSDGDEWDEGDGEGGSEDGGDSLPATVSETRSEIDRLSEERERILTDDLDFEAAKALDRKIRDLQDHLGDLRIQEVEDRRRAEEDYRAKIEESKGRAVNLYPFVSERDSAEVRRMEEIDRELKENGDPLFSSPDKPLRIAQMVAAEFGIAPKSASQKKDSEGEGRNKPTPGKPPRSQGTVSPASAGARTQPTSQEGQLEERIANIKDPLEYEEFVGM